MCPAVVHLRIDGDDDILADGRRLDDVAVARAGYRAVAIGDGGGNLGVRHTRDGYAQRVVIACVKHVHHRRRDGRRRLDDGVGLGEVAPQHRAVALHELHVAIEGEIAYRVAQHAVAAVVLAREEFAAYINIRLLCRIDRREDDVGLEFASTDNCLRIGDDVCIDLVDAEVSHVNVVHKGMNHLALGIAYVVLQLGEQCHCGCNWHILKHILLPILRQCVLTLRHIGAEVVIDDLPLHRVLHQIDDVVTVGVYTIKELLPFTPLRGEHDVGCRFQVLLVLDVVHVAIISVHLDDDAAFEIINVVIERIGTHLDTHRLFVPLSDLLRVLLVVVAQLLIHRIVLRSGVGGRPVEAFVNEREALEHVG